MLTGVVHEATLRRGRLQVKLGLWPLALVDIEAAAQSSAPATRRDAQWELAQLLEAMERPEEALAQTERTLTLAPTLTLTRTLFSGTGWSRARSRTSPPARASTGTGEI